MSVSYLGNIYNIYKYIKKKMEQLSYILLNIKKDFYTENYFIDCIRNPWKDA